MLAWHVPYLGWTRLPAEVSEFEMTHFFSLRAQERNAVLTRYRDCRFQYSLANISGIHGHWRAKVPWSAPRTGDLASIFCSVPAKCRSARRAIHAPLKAMRRI